MMARITYFALLAMLLMLAAAHAANVSQKDVQVIVNSLKYVHGLHQSGNSLTIAALYDGAIPASRADAEQFVAQLDDASPTKDGMTLDGRLVSLQELPQQHGIAAIFIGASLAPKYTDIAEITSRNHMLGISRDRECIRSHACALAVDTKEAVNIFMNAQSMQENGFDVDAAFQFMAKQI